MPLAPSVSPDIKIIRPYLNLHLFLMSTDYELAYVTGVNDESSFESTLLKRAPSCEIWGYDYSVNSVRALLSPYHELDMLIPS
jgi:hypothetical protein